MDKSSYEELRGQRKTFTCPECQNKDHSVDARYCKICGAKIEEIPGVNYKYERFEGVPPLLSEVYVTVAGGVYYKARLLGYGSYSRKEPEYKTYCVQITKDNGYNFVDFFADIYSRTLEESSGEKK